MVVMAGPLRITNLSFGQLRVVVVVVVAVANLVPCNGKPRRVRVVQKSGPICLPVRKLLKRGYLSHSL